MPESNQTESKNQERPVKQRGGWRPNSGRKPSSLPTVQPAAPLAAVEPLKPVNAPDLQAITSRKTPLERLFDAMANPRIPWSIRVRAMGLAAEYVHAKQPQAIHVTQDVRLGAVVVHTMPGPWEPKPALAQEAPETPPDQEQGSPPAPESSGGV